MSNFRSDLAYLILIMFNKQLLKITRVTYIITCKQENNYTLHVFTQGIILFDHNRRYSTIELPSMPLIRVKSKIFISK